MYEVMKNDRQHVSELYERNYERVFNLCYRMSGNYHDSQDLVQETFIKVHQKITSFKQDADISTWIYSIAVNCCLDHLRGRKSMVRGLVKIISGLTSHRNDPSQDNPESQFLNKSEGLELLKKIPPRQRAMIILKIYMGYNYKEIARILKTSPGSVGVELNRVRNKILKLLGEEGGKSQ